jgi:hypothetical protein
MINLLFPYIAQAVAAPITVPPTTVSDLTASLGAQLTDAGTLAVVIFVAAIPLAFYVIRKIIGLIPKR